MIELLRADRDLGWEQVGHETKRCAELLKLNRADGEKIVGGVNDREWVPVDAILKWLIVEMLKPVGMRK